MNDWRCLLLKSVKEELMARRAHRHGVDSGCRGTGGEIKERISVYPRQNRCGRADKYRAEQTVLCLHWREKTIREHDFARFAAAYPAGVRRQLDAFIMKTVLDYENTRLEQKHPDLRCLVRDYEESGCWRIRLRNKEIRKRAATDEAGLQAYFEKHRSDYQWKAPRYKGIVLHGVSKRIAKQARKFLKSLPEAEWKDAIRLTFNAGAQPQIFAEQGIVRSR